MKHRIRVVLEEYATLKRRPPRRFRRKVPHAKWGTVVAVYFDEWVSDADFEEWSPRLSDAIEEAKAIARDNLTKAYAAGEIHDSPSQRIKKTIDGKRFGKLVQCPVCDVVCEPDRAQNHCSQECRRKVTRMGLRKKRRCGHCGESFELKRADARYCSPKCRVYANREKQRIG